VDNNVSTFLAAAAALVCRRRRCLQIRTSESLGFFKLFFVFFLFLQSLALVKIEIPYWTPIVIMNKSPTKSISSGSLQIEAFKHHLHVQL
jgi:hypothetical protein